MRHRLPINRTMLEIFLTTVIIIITFSHIQSNLAVKLSSSSSSSSSSPSPSPSPSPSSSSSSSSKSPSSSPSSSKASATSIVDKFSGDDPPLHSYEVAVDDDSGTYMPHFVIETPVGKKTTIEVTSDTRRKTTRQIFDEGDDDLGTVDDAGDDGIPEIETTSSFEGGRDSSDEAEFPKSSRKKPPARQGQSKSSREEFNGFPDDFMDGMKPFKFEDTAGSHRSSKSTGFVRFNMDDLRFPSLFSLGGMKPFPPSSFSEESTSPDSQKVKRPKITPGSFVKNHDEKDDFDHGFPSSKSAESVGFEEADDFDKGFVDLADGDRDRTNARKSTAKDRNVKRDENEDNDDDNNDNDDDRQQDGQLTDGEAASNQKRSVLASKQLSPASIDLGFQAEGLEPIATSITPESSPDSSSGSSSSSKSKDDSISSASSNIVVQEVLESKDTKYESPRIDEKNDDQKSDSQHLMPHFLTGPPMHFRFRPSLETASHQGPPPIRQFRQASHHRPMPPPFFPSPNRFHNGNADEGFYPGGGRGGGGGEFVPGNHALVPTSHFETLPQRFSQPEFRFPGERQRKLPPPPPPGPHQHAHRPSATSQMHDHSNNEDNHHGASATNNILGSGNFGIIRGGLFADDDNPEPGPSITPLHGYHLASNDDFFHGFRDFQPFGGGNGGGGPMHNALSSKSHVNIHRSQSKTAPVVVLPNAVSSSSPTLPTSTIRSISRSDKISSTADMDEQIMEEK